MKNFFYWVATVYIFLYSLSYFLSKNVLNRFDWAWLIFLLFSLLLINIEKRERYLSKIGKTFFIIYSSTFIFGFLKNFEKAIVLFQKGINFDNINILDIVKIDLLLICYTILSIIRDCEINRKKEEKPVFKEREEDFEYIKKFIKDEEINNQKILGIDGEWGEGKTYLVDKVLDDIKNSDYISYEIIKINSVLIETGDVYPFIIKNLDRILRKNLIFTGHSERIINLLVRNFDSKMSCNLKEVFNRTTISDELDNFKNSIRTLNKKIILVFDDLDRNNNSEKINRILSFACEFTEENIITIILYSQRNLEVVDKKMNRKYIEKYIPFFREITQVPFKELLRIELEKANLDKTKFLFLEEIFLRENKKIGESNRHEIFEGINFFYDYSLGNIVPRKISFFIEEVKTLIGNTNLGIDERITISFIFLKHFFYSELYNKIMIYENREGDLEVDIEKSFPIQIKIGETSISIEEIDLIKNLIKFDSEKIELEKFKSSNIITINDNRYLFNVTSADKEINLPEIETILKKIGIDNVKISEEKELENKDEIKKALENILKNIEKKELDNNDNFKYNYLLRDLFDWHFYFNSSNEEAFERKESINSGISKLKFLGTKHQISSYENFYKKIKPILLEENIEKKSNEYKKLLGDYGDKTIFYINEPESQYEKSMKVLNLFATEEEKIKFFYMILHLKKGELDNECIQILLNGKLLNSKNEISQLIIDKVLSKETKLTHYGAKKILRNIDKILLQINMRIYKDEDIKFIFIRVWDKIKEMEQKEEYQDVESIREIIKQYRRFYRMIYCIVMKREEDNEKSKYLITIKEIENNNYNEAVQILKSLKQEERKKKIDEWIKEEKFKIKEVDKIIKILNSLKE